MKDKYLSYYKTIVAFLVIIGFGSVFVFINPRIYDLIFFISILPLIYINHGKLTFRMLKVVVITFFLLTIHLLLTKSPYEGYLGIFSKITIVVLFISGFKNNYIDISDHLYKSLNIIAYLGIINFILANFLPILFVPLPYEGLDIKSFFYIFNAANATNHFGLNIFRNQGFFIEPGIFQFLMNILIFKIIIVEKKPLYKAIIPFIVIITTFSTTGFIIVGILLTVKLKSILTLKNKIGVFNLFAFSLFVVFFINLLIKELENKFDGDAKASSIARNYDMLMGIEIIKNYPLLGIGYNINYYKNAIKNKSIQINGQYISEERGNSNGLITLFMYMGIPSSLILLYFLFKQSIFPKRNFFFLLICLVLFSEPLLIANFIFLLFLSSVPNHFSDRLIDK
jgi:hypothetical protein